MTTRTHKQAQKIIAAKWQPMSTAPKDGTPVRLKIRGFEHDVIARFAVPKFTTDNDLHKPDKPLWIVYEDNSTRVAFSACFAEGWKP